MNNVTQRLSRNPLDGGSRSSYESNGRSAGADGPNHAREADAAADSPAVSDQEARTDELSNRFLRQALRVVFNETQYLIRETERLQTEFDYCPRPHHVTRARQILRLIHETDSVLDEVTTACVWLGRHAIQLKSLIDESDEQFGYPPPAESDRFTPRSAYNGSDARTESTTTWPSKAGLDDDPDDYVPI